jgi:uncharacterized protein (TIGR02231 family)
MPKTAMWAIVLLLCAPIASAATIEAPSRISAVTLFADRALVTRQASTTVSQGFNTMLLDVQAFRVKEGSATARVFGEGELLSVQLKSVPLEEAPQQKVRLLETQIRELQQSKDQLRDEQHSLNQQEKFLSSFVDFAQAQVPEDIQTRLPTTEDLERLLAFLGQSYQQLHRQKQTNRDAMVNIERELKVLRRELDALRQPVAKTRRVIEIQFNAHHPQQVRIEARYQTADASWAPVYRAAVDEDLSAAELTLFARILQKTGEDWSRVELTISNVVPLQGVELPALRTWRLDLPRPMAATRAKGRVLSQEIAGVADESLADRPAEAAPEPAPAAPLAQAARRHTELAFEYTLGRKLDVESRDKETLLPLFTRKLAGDFYHYCVPKLSPLAYLVCEAQADQELLRGPLDVYFGGRYVGQTMLQEKRAGDRFRLGLGADRAVLIQRRKVEDKRKETFFGKIERDSVVRELVYAITAENLKQRPTTLMVLDHVPVSATDRIEVQDVRLAPEPKERNYQEHEGVMLWELHLEPAAKEQIRIAFTVAYPKNFVPPGF